MGDLRARLAEISDQAFADRFFDRHVEGREVPDYARLLEPAGVAVRPRSPGAAWTGVSVDASGRVVAPQGLVAWGSPAFDAGLAHGDVIVTAGGRPFTSTIFERQRPGDRLTLEVRRAGGRIATVELAFGEDPRLEAVPIETAGGTLTGEMRAFREAWLGSKQGS